jgi:hypothetical protein
MNYRKPIFHRTDHISLYNRQSYAPHLPAATMAERGRVQEQY